MLHKRYVVVGALTLSVALSSCGGTLQIRDQGRAPGLTTATRGIERTGVATPTATLAEAATTPEPVPDDPVAAATVAPIDAAAPPAPATSPTVNPAFANVQIPTASDLEQRWRGLQVDRKALDPHRHYVSPAYQIVWWFDPIFGQIVPLGEIRGEFEVQATFRIAGQWVEALELPYHVNQQYDLIVPEATLRRMQNAGRGEWADVFVYQTKDIRLK